MAPLSSINDAGGSSSSWMKTIDAGRPTWSGATRGVAGSANSWEVGEMTRNITRTAGPRSEKKSSPGSIRRRRRRTTPATPIARATAPTVLFGITWRLMTKPVAAAEIPTST